jgi:uncharacterized membrane protein affecting hemolysin expression
MEKTYLIIILIILIILGYFLLSKKAPKPETPVEAPVENNNIILPTY